MYGTAIFSLNGKTILVRNALYVPNLRDPFYSLQKHKAMPGCGTFSFHGLGSHILFPHFTLSINNSVDSLFSYRSIGKNYNPDKLDYAEPSASCLTATPTRIKDDKQPIRLSPPLPKEILPDVIPPNDAPTPSTITKVKLMESAEVPLSPFLIEKLHLDPTDLPPIYLSSTPSPCANRTSSESLKLHRIFGCRKFKN